MGLLSDQMKRDSEWFVDTDVYGETITYKPRLGPDRSINAVVERHDVVSDALSGSESIAPHVEVVIRNDSTTGVSATELNKTGDSFKLSERPGEAAKVMAIDEIVDIDTGMIHLRLR